MGVARHYVSTMRRWPAFRRLVGPVATDGDAAAVTATTHAAADQRHGGDRVADLACSGMEGSMHQWIFDYGARQDKRTHCTRQRGFHSALVST